MKVLIVNAFDKFGGAARAAYRLHRALIAEGVDSQMLVMSKSSDDPTVIENSNALDRVVRKVRVILDVIPLRLYKNRVDLLFSPSWVPFTGLADKINALNPDIVHLHWIASGMMRIEDIARIKAPVLWSLHDNWAFTGGCHIMWECERYKSSCGSCPMLGSKVEHDLSRLNYLRKQRTYRKVPGMKVIGLSSWMAECAKNSSLFKHHYVHCLPNPIDTEIFAPFDKVQARKLLKLPIEKKLIAFGAISATSDINKGFKKLALSLRDVPMDYELVVFGSSQPENPQGFSQKVHYLGHLHDDVSLRAMYSAADVMVVPSFQEAFGQTASESMACGTPVVAFATSGLLDIVDHQVNGYLAKAFDHHDLAAGINWVLCHPSPSQLSDLSRKKVVREFNSKKVAGEYVRLYEMSI